VLCHLFLVLPDHPWPLPHPSLATPASLSDVTEHHQDLEATTICQISLELCATWVYPPHVCVLHFDLVGVALKNSGEYLLH
jgi:hypothetical protein